MFPAAPDRPDRVNDKAGRQTIAASNFRFPRLTTAQRSTFREQFGAGRAMNRAIDSAATEKCCVSRVYNRVDIDFFMSPRTMSILAEELKTQRPKFREQAAAK